MRRAFLTPRFPEIDGNSKPYVESLGSDYGRKYVVASILGPKPLLVSGGVGEDITFDVEFVSKFGANAVLIDPTPRAIEHISAVVSRFGKQKLSLYSENGKQSPESYDLTKLNSTNLTFHPYALLDHPQKVKFFEPQVSEHVSYSIQNIQNRFSAKGSFIEVSAVGPKEVLDLINNSNIDVLKLDIEGSEYEFLKSAFDVGLFPDQVLVEIDELYFPSLRSRKIAKRIFRLFLANNYQLVFRDGYNFTYLRTY
jgi:FkbM family methyltransferase